MSGPRPAKLKSFLQEFSIPLIIGVFAALVFANLAPKGYHHFLEWKPLGFGVTLHFLINDIFMVLFFGIAAKEITESCLPGGPLNPPSKAVNPLLGTLGGVLGPVAVYLGLVYGFGHSQSYANGWGIPTATDIALAWLVARMVFGKGHPAVNFLLRLAVADDAIGLGIIAIFYPDPAHPVNPAWLLLTGTGLLAALALRRMNCRKWQYYVFGPGVMSWFGLHLAHLHPALALVAVVPFMPSARRDEGFFVEDEEEHYVQVYGHNPLHDFEHALKTLVDFGLFFFAFANAGVEFSDVGPGTWFVLSALLIGKTCGITLFSWLGTLFGAPLPQGMTLRHLFVAGIIAGLGLTVALFVAGEAFTGTLQAEAKMGALWSAIAGILALGMGSVLGIRKHGVSETVAEPLPESAATPDPELQPVMEPAQAEEETEEQKDTVLQ